MPAVVMQLYGCHMDSTEPHASASYACHTAAKGVCGCTHVSACATTTHKMYCSTAHPCSVGTGRISGRIGDVLKNPIAFCNWVFLYCNACLPCWPCADLNQQSRDPRHGRNSKRCSSSCRQRCRATSNDWGCGSSGDLGSYRSGCWPIQRRAASQCHPNDNDHDCD